MKKKITRTETSISSQVALKLKAIRKVKNIQQKDIAKALSLSPQQIACYELGLTQFSLERFVDITKFLDVDPVKLLESCLNNNAERPLDYFNYVISQTPQQSENYDKFVRRILEAMKAIESLNSNCY